MTRRTRLLLAVAASAVIAGGATSKAMAFDEVNWVWDKRINERVLIDISIITDLVPDGLVEVQKLQMYIGDVKAKAEVENISNEDGPNIDFALRIFGEIDVTDLPGVNDAFDLPKIENAATAVANNQSISSDVPILLHDAQFYFGGFEDFSDADQGEVIQGLLGLIAAGFAFDAYADENIHTALALALTAAAAGGIVEKGEVEAEAKVSDILNAYVENSATAVVNNASFTIESAIPGNHILIADLTQWAYADVEAEAKVRDVTINGYTGFGDACFGGACDEGVLIKPIVANVATAVGNNLNIKVGAPEVP